MDRVVEYQVDTRIGVRSGKRVTAAIVRAESGVSLELFYGDFLPSLEGQIGLRSLSEAWSVMMFMPRLQRLRDTTLQDLILFIQGRDVAIQDVHRLAEDLGMYADELVLEMWGYRRVPPQCPVLPTPTAVAPVEVYSTPSLPPMDRRFLRRFWKGWHRLFWR